MKRLTYLFLLFILFFSLTSCKTKNKNVDFVDYINSLSTYVVRGKLETYFPNGSKESIITVYYKSPNNYRTEIQAANTIEKQIIIKNKEGVNVLIPSINKTFKISSDWPTTSNYPYLLSSLAKDIVNDADKTCEDKDDVIIYKVKTSLFNNSFPLTETITINKQTHLPLVVEVKRDEEMITKFTFEEVKINENLDDLLFEHNSTMETLKTLTDEANISYNRTMTYPVYCPSGMSLKEEVGLGSGNDRRYILTYTGKEGKNVTIYEKYANKTDTMKTEYIDGDVFVFGENVYIISDKTMKYFNNGIEYSLSSNEMSKFDVLFMADSLQITEEK